MPSTCRQAKCPLVQTGKCLEGFDDLRACPNYVASTDGTESEASAPNTIKSGTAIADPVSLPTAVALTPEATYEVARGALARVIVCAGEHDCGKTTLLASLYDAFNDGPVGDLLFGGSVTLHAFEERCHTARTASGLDEPKTERTKPVEGLHFLHLRVVLAKTGEATELLLGDMSGELFRNIRDSSEECRKYGFLRRADHFVALLDGEKIADGLQAQAFGNLQVLVRALVNASVLCRQSVVTLLTTKWDLISGSDELEELVARLEDRFRESFASSVKGIACSRVAARPANTDEPIGLEALLARWVAESNPLAIQTFEETPAVRAFDRYATARRSLSPWKDAW